MLDIHFRRENPEVVKKACRDKNMHADIDMLLRLDEERRRLLSYAEEKKHERNRASKKIGEMKRKGKDPGHILAEMKKLSEEIKQMDAEIAGQENIINNILISIPNIPHKSVPVGKDASQNVPVNEWGEKRKFSFKPKTHVELGESKNLIDLKRGAKIAGSGFAVFKGHGALLERALINFMIERKKEDLKIFLINNLVSFLYPFFLFFP